MRASNVRPLALLLLAGCKGCKDDASVPTDLTAISADAVGVYAGEGMGAGTAGVPVYAVNAVGAAVLATDLASDGALTVDAQGWGTVAVDASGPVTASAAGASATGDGWVTAAAAPGFELPGYALGDLVPPDHVAVAGGGAAWVTSGTVWWASSTQPAVIVAVLPDDAATVAAVQLDSDGVTDLVAWSRTSVVLLRGRDGGGLTFAAGWTTANAVVGCDVQDLDGDKLPDVQIAVTDGTATNVLWMLNSGSSWELADWLALDFVAMGVAGEDYTGDGVAEVSTLTENGLLERYARYDKGWSPASSSELQLGLGAGTRMYPSTDLDQDGNREIVAAGPLSDGTGWQAIAVTAGAESTLSYNFYAGDAGMPTGIELAIGDWTGDALPDLALSSDLGLERIAWNAGSETPGFDALPTDGFPAGHGIGLGDMTGDGVQDVLLGADDYVLAVAGERMEDDPDTAVQESWKVTPSTFAAYNFIIAGVPVVADLDGNGHPDVLSFTQSASGLELQTWHSYPAVDSTPEGWTKAGSLLLSAAADPIDVKVCGQTAWALYDESGTSWLRGYSLDVDGVAETLEASVSATGTALLCGPFDDDAGSAVAVVDGVTVTLVAADGTTSTVTDPAGSVTSADVDGDGLRSLVTDESGEPMLAADFDGDGTDEIVRSFDDAIGIADDRPSFGGELSLQDADGDGVADVLLQKDGTVWLYRVIDGALTPPAVFHTTRPVRGPAFFADVSGDGLPDLLMLGSDDDAQYAGTLLYTAGE